MDKATQEAVAKIEKLLRLAAKNPNEAEAAAATAKAQKLLTTYNLDMSVVESQAGAVSGKRLDEQVRGGMYNYQRKLWHNVARLNFCMYWTMIVRVKPDSRLAEIRRRKGRPPGYSHEHRLVGRQVNVIATKNIASYLSGTIERLCSVRLKEDGGQFMSSWAIAYREGIADRVVDKIQDRRRDILKDEERKVREAVRKASRAGVSTATTLTVAGLSEQEEQANYDFLNGEGAWARKEAEKAQHEREWAEHRAEQAKAQAEAERTYAEWAEAHPEEAAKEAAKERSRDRAADRRAARRSYNGRFGFRMSKKEMRHDSGAYHAGWDVGGQVSVDPQVEKDHRRLR